MSRVLFQRKVPALLALTLAMRPSAQFLLNVYVI